jgi:hypothetical protein
MGSRRSARKTCRKRASSSLLEGSEGEGDGEVGGLGGATNWDSRISWRLERRLRRRSTGDRAAFTCKRGRGEVR